MNNFLHTLFFSLLLMTGCTIDNDIKKQVSNLPFFVSYENHEDNDFRLPDSLFEQFYNTEVPLCDTFFNTMNNGFDTIFKIENGLFELLSKSDVINGWAFNPKGTLHEGKTRDDFISSFKQERILYYSGVIPLSKRYKSHVFLSKSILNDDSFEFFEVFIVNMQNQFVKSIIRVHDYCAYDGDVGSTITIREGRNIFLQKQLIESSDNILVGEDYCQNDNVPAFRFRFDRNGYVEIVDYVGE